MQSKAVKEKSKDIEDLRKLLIKKGVINNNLKIFSDDEFVYIPIKKSIPELDTKQIVVKDFQIRENKPRSYVELLNLPNHIIDKLPRSYDVIGDVILVKIPDEIIDYKTKIGKALLEANKNIRSVFLSYSVSGEFRTRKIEKIAGDKNTKTMHVEYGVRFELDIEKTYFSPRLANERRRISNQINEGEIVVDMFTGVAPFPIIIAKYSNPKIIYGIDINKDSIKFARENVRANKLLDKIEIVNSDAKDIKKIFLRKKIKADRIIMNLPFSSYLFFENALDIAKKHCIIHYYDILADEEIQKRLDSLNNISLNKNFKLVNLNINKIKTYAPRVFYIGIDITAKKIADVA